MGKGNARRRRARWRSEGKVGKHWARNRICESLVAAVECGAQRQGDRAGTEHLRIHPEPAHRRSHVNLRCAHALSARSAGRTLERHCLPIDPRSAPFLGGSRHGQSQGMLAGWPVDRAVAWEHMTAEVGCMDGARGIDASPLALLGIGDVEERVYRTLLKRRRAPAAVIADDLEISPDEATRLLEHLESLGLGTHLPESPKAYVAVEPELAIDALIKQRQHALEQARKVVPILARTFAQATVDHADQQPVIESVTNRAHLRHLLAQLHQSSRTDLMVFQKGPVIVPGDQFIGDTVTEALVRTVSDESYLAAPGGLEGLYKDMARGEQ